jgi:signal transduction histidine kinase
MPPSLPSPEMTPVRRAWWWTLAVSLTISALVVAVPALRVGVESVRARTTLETAQALVGFLAGLLVFGRYRRTGRESDLVIAFALFLTSSANLLLELLPARDQSIDPQSFRTWTRLLSRLVAGSALAWAALAPTLALRFIRGRPAFGLWVSVTWTLALITAGCWLLRTPLPPGSEVALIDGRLEPAVTSHPILFAVSLLVVGLYAAASVGFLHHAESSPEPLTISLALGTLLGAMSWGLFLVYPTVFTDIVQLGDLLRLAFYLVLAVGAEREIHTYWSRLVRATASEERRRMARELHDGLAQELAFLSRHTRLLARGDAPDGTDQMLISASDRALDEARRAISALTARDDEPLGAAIASAAEDVAARVGTHARVEVDPSVELPGIAKEAILRIVREAVGNAGRHGQARAVSVELGADRVLRIQDDGSGFDADAATPAGRFGLTSMRERAEGIGGRFAVRSSPGSGTMVEVTLP